MAENRTPRTEGRLGQFKRLVLSLLAGLVGVQSDKNRISDFHSTSIWPFIIGGVVMTALFVLALILLVRTLAP